MISFRSKEQGRRQPPATKEGVRFLRGKQPFVESRNEVMQKDNSMDCQREETARKAIDKRQIKRDTVCHGTGSFVRDGDWTQEHEAEKVCREGKEGEAAYDED